VIKVDPSKFPISTGNWFADTSTSAWIGPGHDESTAQDPGGYFTYTTTFDLTGFDPTTASLTGQWSTDDRVMDAIRLTFEKRRTHPVPSEISPPPLEWEKQFRSLAEECRLSADMNEAFTEVRSFVARLSGKESRR
jgi:hypothetical protein